MGRPPAFTREKLLETARLLFSKHGYEATTLDDIAKELGVTGAALLRHVNSKQQLFLEALGSTHHELAGAIELLETVPGEADPAIVLRQLAQRMIPFLEQRVNELVVLAIHLRSRGLIDNPVEGLPVGKESPPARALAALERYFKRAKAADRIRLKDPKAAALLFLGAIQSYVFFQRVLRVSEPPYPVNRFVDSLIELWSDGAFLSTAAPTRSGGSRGRKKA
jgi:AcrR family transcriptional regulator